MDFGIETLATPAALLFCVGVYAIVFCFRKLGEGIFRKYNLAENYYWREVALPLMPTVVGALLGVFLTSFPFPPNFTGTGARALYGLVCGFASALVYRIAVNLVKRKAWTSSSTPPPNGDSAPSDPG